MTTPVQPHSFPYLVDKFFYTGASSFYYPLNGSAFDPGTLSNPTANPSPFPVVGGPGADGWFKMFEFVEVPTQANGEIGPIALGANFDWLRQDTKAGLMNLNLIIDEEAFFAVFGNQNSSFTQSLLNDIQLPPWPNLPYNLPLINNTSGGNPIPPIPYDGRRSRWSSPRSRPAAPRITSIRSPTRRNPSTKGTWPTIRSSP